MQAINQGYTWLPPRGVTPALLDVRYSRRLLPSTIRRYVLPVWTLDYSYLGGMRFRISSNKMAWRIRKAREAHLYRPGTCFWEDSRPLSGRFVFSTHVTFIGGEGIGLEQLLRPQGYECFNDPTGLLGNLIRQIAETGQLYEQQGFCLAQMLLWRIMALLLVGIKTRPMRLIFESQPKKTATSAFVQNIDAYIEQHMHEKITRHDLARAANISISSLAHKYRTETGMAPMTRLLHLRINRAKHLLLHGVCLKQIAEDTGFTDQFHLSRTFKNIEGIAPRNFLSNIGNNQECSLKNHY